MKEITSLQIGENKIRLNRVIDYTSVKNSNSIVDTSSINGYYSNSYTCPNDGVIVFFGSSSEVNSNIYYYIKDKNTGVFLDKKQYKNVSAFQNSLIKSDIRSSAIPVYKGQIIEFAGLNVGNGRIEFYPYK